MTTTQNLTATTAAALQSGDFLHRVVKTPGRTRVFENAIDETVTEVYPHPTEPGYVVVMLGPHHRLNLAATREVHIVSRWT